MRKIGVIILDDLSDPDKRFNKHGYYMNIARAVSDGSTCLRRKYGAVIVKNDCIVATGYNGSPRGEENCCDLGTCYREEHNIPSGSNYELCLAGSTVVKLLDGTYKTIKDLADSNIESFWVYSVDTSSGKIFPALAHSPRMTGYRSDICNVVLDNGAHVTCTSDHLILLRDCTYKKASDLVYGDSLMPMYYNFSMNNGYESVSNTVNARKEKMKDYWKCNTKSTPTHHIVASILNPQYKGKGEYNTSGEYVPHHKDDNKINNTPSNLELMTGSQHSLQHSNDNIKHWGAKGREVAKYNLKNNPEKAKKRRKVSSECMSRNWEDPEFRKKVRKTQVENGMSTALKTNSDPRAIFMRGRGRVLKSLSLLLFLGGFTDIGEQEYPKVREEYKVDPRLGGSKLPKLCSIKKYFPTLAEAIAEAKKYNHKVVRVSHASTTMPVYDITVPYYHNFAIDLGDNSCIFVHNCRSKHAESNAVLSIGRDKCMGSTLYLYGQQNGMTILAEPCKLCSLDILQCGIGTIYVSSPNAVPKNGIEDFVRGFKYR